MRFNQRKIWQLALIRWNGHEGRFQGTCNILPDSRGEDCDLGKVVSGFERNQLTWMSSLKIALCFYSKIVGLTGWILLYAFCSKIVGLPCWICFT